MNVVVEFRDGALSIRAPAVATAAPPASAPAETQPVADVKPAAEAPRRPVMPAATVDDPGIVAKERKVAVPASTTETAAPASKEAVKKEPEKKKKKSKGLQGKTGTEEWGDD